MGTHQHHHHKPAPFEAPAVRIDGVEIPAIEIAAEMQHHPAAEPGAAWHAAAEALVIRRLLLNEAARQGVDATPEGDETAEDAQLRRLLDAELSIPEADEATCRRWFDANRARFRTPPAWHATHLLIAADPADPAARGAARARAEAALAEVKADPARLGPLAAKLSDCPSREQAGDLGLVEGGSTVPEFEAALQATAAGEVHDAVVETRFGFHVVRVLEREDGRDLPFDAVQDRIASWLRESAWRRAAHQYMALLASRAAVEGIVLSAGADGPLVQ
ncbi:peptidylprolyl isomerase [Falsiroseomonas sp. CW058]|uniref:peptidylprolyl isomerase n=1 Tax=Falsiroseomonas sp. CW058 TaxID=3388664 RepID=UPI003D30F531